MVYYIETNLIAIIVSAILLFVSRSSSKHETTQIIMDCMLWLLIVVSASDAAAYFCRGKSLLGVQLANVLYLEGMALGAFAWFMFVIVRLGYAQNLKSTLLKTGLPIAILCVALALNPLTSFFFSVDDQLLYHRGPGVIVTWVVEWGYMIAALVANIKAVLKETSSYRKKEYSGYLLFAIPMALAAIAQMLVYGITTLQIGFMIALLLVFLNRQRYQVHRDGLTGLNNRNAFLNFQDSELGRPTPSALTLLIADMDNFKQINDTYGHLTGDYALSDAADILKSAASEATHGRLLLFRYGGDEFAIAGRDMPEEEIERFKQSINKFIALKNEENHAQGKRYTLSMSVGHATGECHNSTDFDMLLKLADTEMYAVKQAKKA